MATLHPYLTFNGNCEEAFKFYQSVFGGEFPYVGRFSEMLKEFAEMDLPEDFANRVMHISLPISKDCVLMGSDSFPNQDSVPGSNFSISILCDERDEVDQKFAALSEGGTVIMPLADTFWGSYFGMLTDKFGIQWMVNCEIQTQSQG